MNSHEEIQQARTLALAIEAAIRDGEIRRFRSEVSAWEQAISKVQNRPDKDAAALEALGEALGLAQHWLDFARQWTEERREELELRRQRHKTGRKVIAAYTKTPSSPTPFIHRRG